MAAQNNFRATPQQISAGNFTGQAFGVLPQIQTGGVAGAGANAFYQGLSGAQGALQGAAGTTGQQQSLGQMLMSQAKGGGPNPALTQLKATTAANNAQTAGAAAGQKGLNRAAGARTALDAGAAANASASNAAATERAQQQLSAEGLAASNLQATEAGQLGQASGATGVASTGASGFGTAAGATVSQGQLALEPAQLQLQAELGNQQAVTAANNTNAGITQANTAANNSLIGGGINALGGGISALIAKGGKVPSFAELVAHHLAKHAAHQHLAEGGVVQPAYAPVSPKEEATSEPVAKEGDVKQKKAAEGEREEAMDTESLGADAAKPKGPMKMADGGVADPTSAIPDPTSTIPQYGPPATPPTNNPFQALGQQFKAAHGGAGILGTLLGKGDPTKADPSHVSVGAAPDIRSDSSQLSLSASPGGQGATSFSSAMSAAPVAPTAGTVPDAGPAMQAVGGVVDPQEDDGGHDDTTARDQVPTMLSAGEIVLPRSVSDSPQKAKRFVDHIMATQPRPRQLADVVRRRAA